MVIFGALWDWLKLIWSDWVSRLSGLGSVGAAFAGAYFKWVVDNPRPMLFWVSGICFFITSFAVFYKIRPDLDIEIEDVYLDHGFDSDTNRESPHVTLRMLLTNTRDALNSVKKYQLVIGDKTQRHVGSAEPTKILVIKNTADFLQDLEAHKHSFCFVQGMPQPGLLRFGVQDTNLDDLKGKPFMLLATDAYNRVYKMKGAVPVAISDKIEPDSIKFH